MGYVTGNSSAGFVFNTIDFVRTNMSITLTLKKCHAISKKKAKNELDLQELFLELTTK